MKQSAWIIHQAVLVLVTLSGLLTLANSANAGAFENFFLAIEFDDAPRLKTLLNKGMDPNTVNHKGFPAIILAMKQNSPNAVTLLLQSSQFNPNQTDRRGETPLMVACALNQPKWVETLLSKSAHLGEDGQWTALHNAAASGSTQSLELLIHAGAKVDVLSPNETTPLMMAAREGHENAVRTLLKLGANPTLINQAGYSAATYALKENRNELANEINQLSHLFQLKQHK